MQKMEYRTDKDILYIALEGRIDASNSAEVENEINEIRKSHQGMHTVLDADNLEYISSAGLRIMLRLRKEEPGLAINSQLSTLILGYVFSTVIISVKPVISKTP